MKRVILRAAFSFFARFFVATLVVISSVGGCFWVAFVFKHPFDGFIVDIVIAYSTIAIHVAIATVLPSADVRSFTSSRFEKETKDAS